VAWVGFSIWTGQLRLFIAPWFREGQTVWIDTPRGRLKTRAYESARLGEHPVLVVLVHGDIPDPRQGLYETAQAIAHASQNVVAAGLMRPGALM
jgi:hypothetical protein